jgi:sterol desaturase/sphingolipid hydroxylase (fatty acid hydroxylase superfamily)
MRGKGGTGAAADAAKTSPLPRLVPRGTIPDRAEFTGPGVTLRDAAAMFVRHPNARVLAATTVAAAAGRMALGRWSRRDAVTAAVVVGIEPFVEWVVHVRVLHRLPREVDGRVVDSPLAQSHRAHHRDPRDPELVFIPRPTLAPTIAALGVLNVAGSRAARPAMTGFATAMASLTAYEWTHFLIHSAYRPKSALYRTIRRTHQLHHFRNENYWFGIITPVSDKVLGTYPDKDAVPPSRTAKTLGIA